MTQFMRAHGADPGPTQRPRTTGAIAGAIAALAALGLLWPSGALGSVAHAIGFAPWLTAILQVGLLALMGSIYGWIFRRAADDVRGGWLFGISYGFLIWMLGPATVLRWIVGHSLAKGAPAMGLFGAHLVWGLALGLLFPAVHRLLQRKLGAALAVSDAGTPR